jgi:iron complex outermembrane receptor protein
LQGVARAETRALMRKAIELACVSAVDSRKGGGVCSRLPKTGESTMHSSPAPRSWLIAVAVATALAAPTAALSQEQEQEFEEIVVTGTRKVGLSPTETLSPVDMLSGELLSDQATFDLTEGLPKITPSLNTQRFPIADGTAFIRPVTLRNLSPDHTLVLMNGTRRHRSALVNLQLAPLGTVNQGSQGVDFAAFPAIAIERVEILRDGAAAQYGSDAIAGVVNIILKDAPEGGSLSAQYGEYYESDGERLSVSGNIGLPLGADGFANLSAEYSESDITSRGHPRLDAAAFAEFVPPGTVPLGGLGQRWGDPDVEALKFAVNAGLDLSDTLEVYGFATYMDNTTTSDFFYRGPVITPVQPAGLAARTTLQRDDINNVTLLPGADGLPDPADQSLVDSIVDGGGDPNDYLVPDPTSPSGFALRNPIYTEFPGGYNPDFGADLTDMSFVLGLEGDLTDTLTWDLSGRYAENEVEYSLSDTINPSLGRLSPLSFKPGILTQEESGINLDFVKSFANSPLNVAFGAEFRNETYKIEAGDQASVENGPTAAIFGVGSDGFQGFSPDSAGSFESDSYAGYVETDLTDRLSGAVALRYEDYDEFGDTTDWKVSGRYQFTDAFAIRATANTGFRAPTPGQVNTLNVTTTSDSSGNLIPNGTYPVNHPVAVALGAVPLVPEESEAYTVGLVWDAAERTSVTLDFYHIEIDDRVALLTNTIGPEEVALLEAAGIDNAALLLNSNANFFVNGFDSEVEGIDLALTSAFDLGGGDLVADLRWNYNTQEVSNVTPGTINDARVFDLENQIPENRGVLSFNWDSGGMFGALLRLNYYDGWDTTAGLFDDPSDDPEFDTFSYGSTLLVDAEVSMTFNDMFTVTLGGENIFDEYPDDELDGTLDFLGVNYALTSPYGFNGGFYYLRLSASF